MKATPRRILNWHLISSLLLVLGCTGPSRANAAQILFVINSVLDPATTANALDQEVRDRLVAQGHTVTLADDDTVSAGDLTGKDLVLISSSVASGAPGVNPLTRNTLKTGDLPVINWEPGLYDEFGWQTATVFNNPGNQTDIGITIAGAAHRLGAGKPAGVLTVVEPGLTATFSLPVPPIASSAIIIATNANPGCTSNGGNCTGVPAIFAFERGSTMIDGSVSLGRKIAWPFNATTGPAVLNADAYALFDAALNWALSIGEPGPIVLKRVPGPGQTGAFPDTPISVVLRDGTSTQVNTNTISLSLDGNPVTTLDISKSGTDITVSFTPATLFAPGSTHTATLVFSDTAAPPQSQTSAWSFTVENYPTLTPDLARPAGTVDTTTSGFSGTVHQARADSLLPNSIRRAEDQLRGVLKDPLTGAPYVNHATVTNFTDENVINWNRDAGGLGNEIGNFRGDSAPPFPDEPIPGIPGDEASFENIAAEVISFLDLPAGLIRLGVNSDDNFRLTSAVNPRDIAALRLGTFDLPAGRGSADTIFSVFVQTAGIYPVRLVWEQGQGGANLEFFSVDLPSSQKILINDRSNAKAIRGYRVSTYVLPPVAEKILPPPGAVNVNASTEIFVRLRDQQTRVNQSSVTLTFNGAAVQPALTKDGESTLVSYDPPGLLLAGSTNTVTLVFQDDAATPNSITNTWSFVAQDYSAFPIIPENRKLASVDTAKPGFLLKFRRMEVARPGPDENVLPLPLIQLDDGFIDPATGQAYADLTDRSQPGFNPDGTYTEAGIINYNIEAGVTEQGVFRATSFPDALVPGQPAGLNNGADHIVMLASTVAELKAGVYQMAVNSDDGFLLAYDDPRDIFGQGLGLFNAGRGSASTFFNFVVPADGYYPLELIWWQGGGGANVEWFTSDATTGEQILLNDLMHANAFQAKPVKSFRPPSISSARPFVRSVIPARGATSVSTNTTVGAAIVDGIAKVVTNSVQLFLNGTEVAPTIAQAFGVTTVSFAPLSPLPYLSSNSATLVFSDNGSPTLTRTNSWSFTVESALPKALFIVANPAALNPSDAAVKARLESLFGFEVVTIGDAASQPGDAAGKALVVNSSTVASGSVGTKFQTNAVPIINWEQALQDEYLFTLDSVADHGTTPGQTDLIITDAAHPLAAGLSAGNHTVVNSPATVSWGLPATSAKIVATLADGTGSACLYAFDRSALLIDGATAAPARRVHIFLDSDTFALLNADGLKLFDGAVRWAANLPSNPPPIFNPPVVSANQVAISWTGSGTLQEATDLTGKASDWSDVNPQPPGNTFTATPSSAIRKFYRIRQ